MKFAGLALWCIGIAFAASGQENFFLSLEQAKEWDDYSGTKFVDDIGDATGPFRPLATVEIDPLNQIRMEVREETRTIGTTHLLKDFSSTFRVDIFLSADGGALGVFRKKKGTPPDVRSLPALPEGHLSLCAAAELAIREKRLPMLKLLVKNGLSVKLPLDLESKETPLHQAARSGSVPMVEFLLAKHSDRDARNAYGMRPIETAMGTFDGPICQLLKKEDVEESVIDGVPEGLLNELLLGGGGDPERLRFVEFNAGAPSTAMHDWLIQTWPNVESPANLESIDGVDGRVGGYQSKISKKPGTLIQLTVEKGKDGVWFWRRRQASGPVMAGGGAEGTASKQLGYWILQTVRGWDE